MKCTLYRCDTLIEKPSYSIIMGIQTNLHCQPSYIMLNEELMIYNDRMANCVMIFFITNFEFKLCFTKRNTFMYLNSRKRTSFHNVVLQKYMYLQYKDNVQIGQLAILPNIWRQDLHVVTPYIICTPLCAIKIRDNLI